MVKCQCVITAAEKKHLERLRNQKKQVSSQQLGTFTANDKSEQMILRVQLVDPDEDDQNAGNCMELNT